MQSHSVNGKSRKYAQEKSDNSVDHDILVVINEVWLVIRPEKVPARMAEQEECSQNKHWLK